MRTLPKFVDYKFLGVKPFTKTLDENSIDYILFDDTAAIERLFRERSGLLKTDDDTLKTGKCLNNDIEVYFAEFGIKITRSFRSYVVFIYNRHPVFEDILSAADSLEKIITDKVDNIDPSEIAAIQ